MADNIETKAASTVPVATDVVTYSGDPGQNVQLIRPVLVTGSEGSKTVVDLTGDNANGLDVDVTRLPSLVAGTAYIGKVRATDGTNDLTFATASADAASNTVNLFPTHSFSLLYNGATWDRVRGDTTNGMDVDITRMSALVAGTAYIGKVRLHDGTNDSTFATAGADASSNTVNLLPSTSYNLLYNGATWDRMRGDTTNGLDVDVTRMSALVAGTAYIGKVRLHDGTNDASFATAGADARSNTANLLAAEAFSLVYNGATWDRLRGDTTNGAFVNVKATLPAGGTVNSTSSDGGTALTNAAQAIKASAGVLDGYYIYNPNATAQFVNFYNTAFGSVTVGTTNPLFQLTIPPLSAANLSFNKPVPFGTAMSWSASSTAGGAGAPSIALDAVCWFT